LELHQIIIPLC